MPNLIDLSANLRAIILDDALLELRESQALDGCALGFRKANKAFGPGDL